MAGQSYRKNSTRFKADFQDNAYPQTRQSMRILFANIVYPTPMNSQIVGGAEVSVKALAETFASMGHAVAVIRGHESDLPDTFEIVNGVEVYSFNIRNFYWPFDRTPRGKLKKLLWHVIDNLGLAPKGVDRVFDEFKPDVVHTNNIIGLSWGIWRKAHQRNIPIMHVLRDYYLSCGRSARFKHNAICKTTCRECKIATYKRSAMTKLVQGVSGNSLATLHIHLQEGLFANARVKTNIANIAVPREIEKIPSETLRFGFIGRASVEKGLEFLATSYGATRYDCQLVIAGEAREEVRSDLQALSGKPIKFLGFVPPESFYSQVDVVVVPSLWAEPLPRAVLEAYSYGLPVLGSDRGGIPEAIGSAGGGWLFDPNKIDSLTALMDMLCADPLLLDHASTKAKERAEDFSKEKIVAQHFAALKELVGHEGSSR